MTKRTIYPEKNFENNPKTPQLKTKIQYSNDQTISKNLSKLLENKPIPEKITRKRHVIYKNQEADATMQNIHRKKNLNKDYGFNKSIIDHGLSSKNQESQNNDVQ